MNQLRRERRHRLSIDIPLELYTGIKLQTIHYRITMTKYVIKALLEKMKREEPLNLERIL